VTDKNYDFKRNERCIRLCGPRGKPGHRRPVKEKSDTPRKAGGLMSGAASKAVTR
jgi:hypothetical protein